MQDNISADDFDDLVAQRQQLQDFCLRHFKSVFAFSNGVGFKIYRDEKREADDLSLSSTATCYESLLACPEKYFPKSQTDKGWAAKWLATNLPAFIDAALALDVSDWKSGGSASVYCKARTLPLVIRRSTSYNPKIPDLLRQILAQLTALPKRFAIGEASIDQPADSYPANGFHTYWTLLILEEYEKRQADGFPDLKENLKVDLSTMRAEMIEWARQLAGYQISLHAAQSTTVDSDQLAWAFCILLNFDDHFQASLSRQDFIRQGIKCLFEAQTKVGTWRRGAPLFHYRNSGNAYCYVFETFAALLGAALKPRPESMFLRQVLKPYASKLFDLWKYALSTQTEDGSISCWSSGHRINHLEPESWATASVFAFTQSLRRLIGIWVREMAEVRLNVRDASTPSDEAVDRLCDRGDSWPEGGASVADRLITFFVNPVLKHGSGRHPENRLEPDSQPVDEDQARAAILFGPPGASKTTLCRGIAEAIGWSYMELHASHFVADGLSRVQRTADTIFKELMQLDRTVILFDEIDELVRSRDRDADAFGRFLTTSMLPKLAELWKSQKVMYFVATNYISYFDSAIIRAERFDALISVPPPALGRKIDRINSLLKLPLSSTELEQMTVSSVEASLKSALEYREQKVEEMTRERDGQGIKNLLLPKEHALAKLLLMRWDQLNEFADLIERRRKANAQISILDICNEFSDRSLRRCDPFFHYAEGREYNGHDFGKAIVWKVEKNDGSIDWLTIFGRFDEFDASKYKKIKAGTLKDSV